jgi:hypothetical protein
MSASVDKTNPWTTYTLQLPNAIQTEDGKILALRKDHFSLTSDSVTTNSTLLASNLDLLSWNKGLSVLGEFKLTVIRHADKTYTITLQYETPEDKGTQSQHLYVANYALKETETTDEAKAAAEEAKANDERERKVNDSKAAAAKEASQNSEKDSGAKPANPRPQAAVAKSFSHNT